MGRPDVLAKKISRVRSTRRSFVMALLAFAATIFTTATYAIVLPEPYPYLRAPLTFASDDSFQLSIFGDLHFGENAWDTWGPQQDIWSQYVMNQVLDTESPGLVVLNGDLITGENGFLENSTVYIDEIVQPLVNRSLTWASTYGNHDSQYNLSREAILAREHKWPNARTTQMVHDSSAGVSNYYLPVYPHKCNRWHWHCAPDLLLWFFDSRGGNYFQQLDDQGNLVPQPDWVDQSVVDWFQHTSSQLSHKYHKTIPSLAFVHIPTNASHAFQVEVGPDAHKEPGVNDDYPLAQQAQGWCANGVNNGSCHYGGQDLPFMSALVSTPGLMAVFSGHDHGDTWCYKWDSRIPGVPVDGNGINLCFGQHSGYGGYGSWIRGARQVRATKSMLENFEVETWIRLEDQSTVGAVRLNSTYGEDSYPATPNDMTHCPTC